MIHETYKHLYVSLLGLKCIKDSWKIFHDIINQFIFLFVSQLKKIALEQNGITCHMVGKTLTGLEGIYLVSSNKPMTGQAQYRSPDCVNDITL